MAKHKDFSELFDPSKPMLQVRNLTRLYPQKGGSLFRKPKQVHAVDGVSFTLQEREIFGVIGESGCGKSTLGRLLIRLEEPTSGEIDFYGISTKKLLEANPEQFHCLVQSVFQNPFDTFTPSDTIGAIMERPLKLHNIGSSDEERRQICVDALTEGGLTPAESFLSRYPHELSGGQLQRISILRSMLLKPRFLVVDEPVSMLDVRPGGHHQHVPEAGGAPQHQHPFHQPRYFHHPLRLQPGGGHVSGQYRGDGGDGYHHPSSHAPLYAGADLQLRLH